ncbi:MAG: hypothetical protein Q7V58_10045 [Actinomycetota bacterium]|nr:hypothetical protein [Actinomycetota bacterium]
MTSVLAAASVGLASPASAAPRYCVPVAAYVDLGKQIADLPASDQLSPEQQIEYDRITSEMDRVARQAYRAMRANGSDSALRLARAWRGHALADSGTLWDYIQSGFKADKIIRARCGFGLA